MKVRYNPTISLKELERDWIMQALEYHEGNIMATARSLSISRETLYRKLRKIADGDQSWQTIRQKRGSTSRR